MAEDPENNNGNKPGSTSNGDRPASGEKQLPLDLEGGGSPETARHFPEEAAPAAASNEVQLPLSFEPQTSPEAAAKLGPAPDEESLLAPAVRATVEEQFAILGRMQPPSPPAEAGTAPGGTRPAPRSFAADTLARVRQFEEFIGANLHGPRGINREVSAARLAAQAGTGGTPATAPALAPEVSAEAGTEAGEGEQHEQGPRTRKGAAIGCGLAGALMAGTSAHAFAACFVGLGFISLPALGIGAAFAVAAGIHCYRARMQSRDAGLSALLYTGALSGIAGGITLLDSYANELSMKARAIIGTSISIGSLAALFGGHAMMPVKHRTALNIQTESGLGLPESAPLSGAPQIGVAGEEARAGETPAANDQAVEEPAAAVDNQTPGAPVDGPAVNAGTPAGPVGPVNYGAQIPLKDMLTYGTVGGLLGATSIFAVGAVLGAPVAPLLIALYGLGAAALCFGARKDGTMSGKLMLGAVALAPWMGIPVYKAFMTYGAYYGISAATGIALWRSQPLMAMIKKVMSAHQDIPVTTLATQHAEYAGAVAGSVASKMSSLASRLPRPAAALG